MNTPGDQDPVVILARTMYGEARGEYARLDGGLAALLAVGNVVTNRVKACSWFGRDVASVCLKPAQFSFWMPSDPNHEATRKAGPQDKVFRLCLELARHVCQGDFLIWSKAAPITTQRVPGLAGPVGPHLWPASGTMYSTGFVEGPGTRRRV